ncbi:Fur family transcriptional regulator [Acetobacter sp. TBRC 12305]|uniref:Fur family transcriptional regulator n=1 Tax=Acetobacter garciniae TaxID=2817435 RepID=A0A939HKZ7_9PROT|nr:Fur family transcriptional regulator [Acetobacter garciniae]MBO1324660.1 Fur family transcriptional regulator [Acetobacter garciniae]MBX0344349.1 Fur family transcriptional regulator [Acetobacter garciniae]
MPVFPEHRRSRADSHRIRPGMGANAQQVLALEERCGESGLKMTDLRRVLLHGILKTGNAATTIAIWKTIAAMVEGHPPSQGSIQRNLNLLVEHDVLRRDAGVDRIWRYRVSTARRAGPMITFVEAGTGRKIPCDSCEITAVLRLLMAERGLAVQEASIIVAPMGDPVSL